ncbi:MAG: class I SAM-dependent methyltransferase [Alphaproteobacteria bacterium]|nr:class I SAM-dependent methyltransferase [Alphaproteobacteria bacterium]
MKPMPCFDTVAKYYDEAFGTAADLGDVEMYKSFARRFGGPVLEIGCGTGRVLKPIADMGIEIDGIDVSEAMISILKSKIADISPMPNICLGDMRRIELTKRYRLVTIPFRTLQHMITIEDKLQALAAAKNHLLDDGHLIFDVAFPNYESLASGFGEETLSAEWRAETKSDKFGRMFFRREGYCQKDQVMIGSLIFRLLDGDNVLNEEIQPLQMHFFSFPEIEALCNSARLEIEEFYGSYDLKPFEENSTQMVFVVKASR